MRTFVILMSFVAACYGGVGVLTPEIEQEALRLWQAYCDGASEGGMDANAYIYCKKSTDKIEESLTHEMELTAKEGAQDQVVFVQPPSYHYKHDVIVSGGGGSAPKTIIYVKPASNTHEVAINDQTEKGAAPVKPTLYFLKSHGEETPTAPAARKRREHSLEEGQNSNENSNQNQPQRIAPAAAASSIVENTEIAAPRRRIPVYIVRTMRQ